LAHLLLDAAGRRRDEVLPRRVQQEHGRGVDLEELTNTIEQLDEQLLDPEVAESGVRHRLDATEPFARNRGFRRHVRSLAAPGRGLFKAAAQE
jgi:hypothetical protein